MDGSVEREAVTRYLTAVVGLRDDAQTASYVSGLVAQGYDQPDLIASLTRQELIDDFGFKKGHALRMEKHRLSAAPPADAPDAVQTGEPVGTTLPDGTTIRILTDRVGNGGSGVVFKAERIGRDGQPLELVAAKMLGPGAVDREVQRFHKEFSISLLAAQRCSGACRIYGCVTVNGSLCLIMKLYKSDFAQLLESRRDPPDAMTRAPMPIAQASEYILQIAQALVELHAAGIRVQDLKPTNILVDDDGRLYIADFGVASLAEATLSTGSASRSGAGTPVYMAPEQHDARMFGRVTEAADVWAWACIVVEVLSGRVPWEGMRHTEVITNVVVHRRSPSIPPGTPTSLSSLLSACFSHDATARPQAPQIVHTLQASGSTVLPVNAAIPGHTETASLLSECHQGSPTYVIADSLLQGTWAKRSSYTFLGLTRVQEIQNQRLVSQYENYKLQMPEALQTSEQLLFHGGSQSSLDSIAQNGFLKVFWTSAAGAWQRFGPGFYFSLQASKSHEYPVEQMQSLAEGVHERSMLLCKVAKGNCLATSQNMDQLQGSAPPGYHSIHGVPAADGPLKFDELVVFDEAAVLPYAIVTYKFAKLPAAGAVGPTTEASMVDSFDGLLRAAGATPAEVLAFSKDDIAGLITELGLGVVARHRILEEAEGELKIRADVARFDKLAGKLLQDRWATVNDAAGQVHLYDAPVVDERRRTGFSVKPGERLEVRNYAGGSEKACGMLLVRAADFSGWGWISAHHLMRAVVQTYRCVRRCQIQVEYAMDSFYVAKLEPGSVVTALEERVHRVNNGHTVKRIRLQSGWISDHVWDDLPTIEIADPGARLPVPTATAGEIADPGARLPVATVTAVHRYAVDAVGPVGPGDDMAVRQHFLDSWKHEATAAKPRPKAANVVKVIAINSAVADNFHTYESTLRAQGRGTTGNSADPRSMLFHGTGLCCTLGLQGQNELCVDPACSTCRIIESGFDRRKEPATRKWNDRCQGRYGKESISATPVSSKAHDYVQLGDTTHGITGQCQKKILVAGMRCVMLCQVAGGRIFKDGKCEWNKMSSPPSGYDSILGVAGPQSELNYDEIALFNNDAILPRFLIYYTLPVPKCRACGEWPVCPGERGIGCAHECCSMTCACKNERNIGDINSWKYAMSIPRTVGWAGTICLISQLPHPPLHDEIKRILEQRGLRVVHRHSEGSGRIVSARSDSRLQLSVWPADGVHGSHKSAGSHGRLSGVYSCAGEVNGKLLFSKDSVQNDAGNARMMLPSRGSGSDHVYFDGQFWRVAEGESVDNLRQGCTKGWMSQAAPSLGAILPPQGLWRSMLSDDSDGLCRNFGSMHLELLSLSAEDAEKQWLHSCADADLCVVLQSVTADIAYVSQFKPPAQVVHFGSPDAALAPAMAAVPEQGGRQLQLTITDSAQWCADGTVCPVICADLPGLNAAVGRQLGLTGVKLELFDEDFEEWCGAATLDEVPDRATVRIKATGRAAVAEGVPPTAQPARTAPAPAPAPALDSRDQADFEPEPEPELAQAFTGTRSAADIADNIEMVLRRNRGLAVATRPKVLPLVWESKVIDDVTDGSRWLCGDARQRMVSFSHDCTKASISGYSIDFPEVYGSKGGSYTRTMLDVEQGAALSGLVAADDNLHVLVEITQIKPEKHFAGTGGDLPVEEDVWGEVHQFGVCAIGVCSSEQAASIGSKSTALNTDNCDDERCTRSQWNGDWCEFRVNDPMEMQPYELPEAAAGLVCAKGCWANGEHGTEELCGYRRPDWDPETSLGPLGRVNKSDGKWYCDYCWKRWERKDRLTRMPDEVVTYVEVQLDRNTADLTFMPVGPPGSCKYCWTNPAVREHHPYCASCSARANKMWPETDVSRQSVVPNMCMVCQKKPVHEPCAKFCSEECKSGAPACLLPGGRGHGYSGTDRLGLQSHISKTQYSDLRAWLASKEVALYARASTPATFRLLPPGSIAGRERMEYLQGQQSQGATSYAASERADRILETARFQYFRVEPDNTRVAYTTADNAVIEQAHKRGDSTVRISDVVVPGGKTMKLEVRFGAAARNTWSPMMSRGSPTGMIQVNLDTKITQRVERKALVD